MKKILVTVAIVAVAVVGFMAGRHTTHDIQYTVDRVEDGAHGEQWVVVEVYDKTTDTCNYINVKAEECYRVVDNY